MITAKEVKALYEQSGAAIEEMLTRIEPQIVAAATAGKESVFIHIGSAETHKRIDPTTRQRQLMKRLNEFGFLAHFTCQSETYVPASLRDDEGHGPLYSNFGITISW